MNYICRCVIITHADQHERCGSTVSNDQPFCRSCEDRHEGQIQMGDIKGVTQVPIGVPA